MTKNWTTNHGTLLKCLQELIIEPSTIQRMVTQANMNSSFIDFSGPVATIWFRIIGTAGSEEIVNLIEQVMAEHPNNETLKAMRIIFETGGMGLSLRPAETQIPQADVESINLPRIQKEGGYVIEEPPEGWIVKELNSEELLAGALGSDLAEELSDSLPEMDTYTKRMILKVTSPTRYEIETVPGESLMNGRKTVLFVSEDRNGASLTIQPIERNSTPPNFIRQSLAHIFITQLTSLLSIANLKTIVEGSIGQNKSPRFTAELDQRLENIVINGKGNQSVTLNITLIGIQGITKDYLLALSYLSHATIGEREIEKQRGILQKLVNSFKLIKPTNADEEEQKSQALGTIAYEHWMRENFTTVFVNQLAIIVSQWKNLDWNNIESKTRFVRDLKRMEKAIEGFGIKNERLLELLADYFKIAKISPSKIKTLICSEDFDYIKPLPEYVDLPEVIPSNGEETENPKKRRVRATKIAKK